MLACNRKWLFAIAAALLAPLASPAAGQYLNFEGHQIHPLEVTPDGSKLLAINTPDARLAIFDIGLSGALTLAAEVPVGIEPVSVRARSNGQAWVVNHISDSISVVDLSPGAERVVRTIATDDEPSDVVFAGTGDARAFVSISQRNRVDVYDAANPTIPLFAVEIDGEDPRALARNSAGTEVYAAVFHSGNQTMVLSGETGGTVPRSFVTDGDSPYDGAILPPPPGYNANSPPFNTRPETGVIVKWRNCEDDADFEWCDDNDNSWNDLLETESGNVITMPDRDVAILDADAATVSVTDYATGVGTLNFGIAVQPGGTQRFYVSNTDARNDVRLERGAGSSLNGHLVDTRITVGLGASVLGFLDLNPHIDYNAAIETVDKSQSLGQPNGMVFNAAGTRLYVASLLSKKIAVLDTTTVPGAVLDRIDVGEGPTGVALAESKNRLYVMNRFDNSISIVDTATRSEILPRVTLYNPEPAVIRDGRRFLYDAQISSGRGDVSCATCHTFGNFDLLAWDLGDALGTEPFEARPPQPAGGPTIGGIECEDDPNKAGCGPFHPLKGPFTTQSLRGLSTTEPFHWRGDRENFQAFNVAFPGLLKRNDQLTTAEINAFTDFIMSVVYPPNPNRNIDDTLTASAEAGRVDYMTSPRDANFFTCNDCHALPTGTNGRFITFDADQVKQALKVPQLRNMYEKTGRTLSADPAEPVPDTTRNGYGFAHNGDVKTLEEFLSNPIFTFVADGDLQELADVIEFMLEFPTGVSATTGLEVTFDGTNLNDPESLAKLSTLVSTVAQGKIDLIAKAKQGTPPISRGYHCIPTGPPLPGFAACQPDEANGNWILATNLRLEAAAGNEVTFRAVPTGHGQRAGIDRDGDSFFDFTELSAGTDPADPLSFPTANGAPEVTSPGDQTHAENTSVTLQIVASDPDSNPLSYTANGLPVGLAIDGTTGLITGTIDFAAAAASPFATTVEVNDGTANASASFSWTVTNTNRSPIVTSPGNQASAEGEAVSIAISGSDPDGTAVSYSASGLPTGLSIHPTTGLITGTIDFAASAASPFAATVEVSDGTANASASFSWAIIDTNQSPVVTSPGNQASVEGEVVSIAISGSDPDGSAVSYSASGLPTGLSIHPTTGLITGTIDFAASAASPFATTVEVSDGTANASASFSWTVTNTNQSPIVTSPGNQASAEGEAVSIAISGSDPDGSAVSYSASGLPTGLSIHPTTGLITGTIDFAASAASPFAATVEVNDGNANASASFNWTVANTNRVPVVSVPANQISPQGVGVSLPVIASDPDGETLHYASGSLPDGLHVEPTTGVIEGTVTDSALGASPYTVTVTVSDTSGGSTPATFFWTVVSAADVPAMGPLARWLLVALLIGIPAWRLSRRR